MKKTAALLTALWLAVTISAQTLSVTTNKVTYLFPAAIAGEMVFSGEDTLTILNKRFPLGQVSRMEVEDTDVPYNMVSVAYSGDSASVTVSGNIARYVEAGVSGAHVTVELSNTAAVDGDEITCQLSGATSDGSFSLSGSYKCTISLAGVTLANPQGAAITISNSKRIQISAQKDTENILSDCSGGSQKACLYSKGQLQLQGNGKLSIVGNTRHGIKSASYISVKNLSLNIMAAGDAVNCEEYFLMKSGSLTLSGVGDDGIQCDLGGHVSTGEIVATATISAHEDEDSGNVYLQGGTLTVKAEAAAAKCIKAEGDVVVSGGTVIANADGPIDVSTVGDPSYTAGIKAAASYRQVGGSVTVNVGGAAGRGISSKALDMSDGALTVVNKGETVSGTYSGSTTKYFCTAKGLKSGVVTLGGGTVNVTVSGAASKGIKADTEDSTGVVTVTGGTMIVETTGAAAYDTEESSVKGCSGLNADGAILISGGTLSLTSNGSGGKGISGDATLSISGTADMTVTTSGEIAYYSSGRIQTTTSSETVEKLGDAYKTSPKGIKSDGAMSISGGNITVSSSYHEGIETKSTLDISGGYVYSYSSDDAVNSSSTMTISDGYIMANSSGNDGLDSNANLAISGGVVVAVAARSPEVGIDAAEHYTLSITGGNIIAIGGLESGYSLTGTAYQASSYNKGSWYAFYSNSGSLMTAFRVPSNSSMGTPMVVYTSTGTPTLMSGVAGSGTAYWNGYGYSSCSGGSSVKLLEYTGSDDNSGGKNDGGGHR